MASHPCKNFWTSFFVKRCAAAQPKLTPDRQGGVVDIGMGRGDVSIWAGFRGGQGLTHHHQCVEAEAAATAAALLIHRYGHQKTENVFLSLLKKP